MIQRLKKAKENKKGFTLVELIVVLVILAILIALLVPSLTGYIAKARKKAVLVEARNMQMAAQTVVSEKYDKDLAASGKFVGGTTGTVKVGAAENSSEKEIADLAEMKTGAEGTVTYNDKGQITAMTYTNKGWTTTYAEATGWGEPTEKSTN